MASAQQQGEQSHTAHRGLCTLLLGEAMCAQDVLLARTFSEFSPLSLRILLCLLSAFGHFAACCDRGSPFPYPNHRWLFDSCWLALCVCSRGRSCFDVGGFDVLFKWEESSLGIPLIHCGHCSGISNMGPVPFVPLTYRFPYMFLVTSVLMSRIALHPASDSFLSARLPSCFHPASHLLPDSCTGLFQPRLTGTLPSLASSLPLM